MNKFIIAIISISIGLTSACSLLPGKIETIRAEDTGGQKPKKERPAIKKPVVGDAVVARWGPALWAEGRVASFNDSGSEASITWADKSSSPSYVDVADIFPLPRGGDAITVAAGDYALIKGGTDEWWTSAEVKEISGSIVKAKLINGGEIVNVPTEKVLMVSDAVAADIKDEADRVDFLNKAHEHHPVRPTGYLPKVGDHVLAEWTSNAWYGGKIKAIKDDKATIAWENGMSADDAALEKIVPFPTAENASAPHAVGDYVLVKPANGNPKANWLYAQITALNGTGIEAKSDDATREYKAGDYIVLGK
jgi:hypothetical protein